jgi:hypothetical protein
VRDVLIRNISTASTTLVSVSPDGLSSGDQYSAGPEISDDGNVVAFYSSASNLVATDTNGTVDIFARNISGTTTTLVSVRADGLDSSNNGAFNHVMSDDGNVIAFASYSDGLVTNDTNGVYDIFARNISNETTTLVSVLADGSNGGNRDSLQPVINVDGSVIAFRSDAFDFVADDTNDRPDVFVSDLTNPVMLASRADVTVPNLSGNASSGLQSSTRRQVLSEDGRYLIFQSNASNLVPNNTNGLTDVFHYDRQTGEILLISASVGGADSGNGYSTGHVISADGNRIAFTSAASDLVANDDNGGTEDVFVGDVAAGTTTLVSIRMDELGSGDSISFGPVISADGNVVAFESYASDLTANDTDFNGNVFTRNLGTDTTTLVSVRPDGVNGGDSGSSSPAISADGNMVAFMSYASDLVANDTNSNRDVFVRDISGETTTLISARPDGPDSGDSYSYNPTISANGNVIAFESHASNLVANDGNFSADVFVRDLSDASAVRVSALPDNSDSGDSFSGNATISGDGNVVAFVSTASDLVPNDDNSTADVFARDLSTGATTIVSAVPDTTWTDANGLATSLSLDTSSLVRIKAKVGISNFSLSDAAINLRFVVDGQPGTELAYIVGGDESLSLDAEDLQRLEAGDHDIKVQIRRFNTISGATYLDSFAGARTHLLEVAAVRTLDTVSAEVLSTSSSFTLDPTWVDAGDLSTTLSLNTDSVVRLTGKIGSATPTVNAY